ncbi:RNA polymerase sigma factor [Nocardia carnea]|uniref:RNA polymerase sigma factor n=1 Tax=Nocardia carnea TaxID=37328 RepID=UPI00245761D5|nr:RNA polymerase sigma factor [Nocardia carnea]
MSRVEGGSAAETGREQFDELLREALVSGGDLLLHWVGRQVGNHLDAEDIVQTALLRIYATKPDISTALQLRAYLWTVTKNLVRDAWRCAAQERERLDIDGDARLALLADDARLHFEDVVAIRRTLIGVLETLPRREREAVVLRAYEGHTYAETARIMGVSTGTAKSYVHDALRRVRNRLDLGA